MVDIKKRIAVIEELVAEGTIQSLTYAALECRLTIEQICYERLQISHDYISTADLRTWSPVQVVKQVSEEANEYAAASFTISVAKEPVKDGFEPKTIEDYEAFDYVELGKQAGFDIRKMSKLWNSVSNVALHISLPQGKEPISTYGKLDSIRAKVTEAVSEFEKFEQGNLLSSGIGEVFSFRCEDCDVLIRKKVDLLKDGQIVNCANPLCDASFGIHRHDNEIMYHKRELTMKCTQCDTEISFAAKKAEQLRFGKSLEIACPSCQKANVVRLNIVQERPDPKAA